MIEELVPAGTGSAEAYDDRAPAPLFPGEEELVARAAAARAREFATTRACARRALAQLGLPPVPVLRSGRAPRWPDGVVGSLTHCDGYRAAVVGPVTRFRALGIDAEPDLPLPPGVLGLIAGTDDEQPMLRALAAGDPGVNWSRLLFCAKEAVFKAWSPLTGSWLGCAGAEVRIRTDGTFRARVRPTPGTPPAGVTGGVDTFTGRWLARDGLLLAAVVVPAPSSSASPDTAEIHPTCASLAPAQQP